MTQITLRITDPQMEKFLRRKAKEAGTSLNKAAQELMRAGAGLAGVKRKPRGASLASLAGGWTEEEGREFEESIRIFEEIDADMWK